jgi:bile acid:Na+ symporter, BASS family
MSLHQYALLTIQLSVVCIVFSLGLMSTMADLLYLWRRPALLVRSLVAMLVVMPIVAVGLTQWVDARTTAKIALIAMAISPMPPLLPRREVNAGGHQPYAVSLLATLALLAIVTIPLSAELLAAYYRRPLTGSASAIARLAFASVLLPLVAGIAVREWTTVARRLAPPTSQLGMWLLVAGLLLLLSGTWRGVWGAVGDGTVIMVAAFVALGLVVGHLMGGPDPRQAAVLGLSTACRHPAIALSAASANFPGEQFAATVLLYQIVAVVLLTPYVIWSRGRIAAWDAPPAVGSVTGNSRSRVQ